MLKISDIVKIVAAMVYKATDGSRYKYKITADEDKQQQYINNQIGCFFIDIHIAESKSVNLHFNEKKITIDINCFPQKGQSKMDLYEIKDLLDKQFVRSLHVGDRYIHISSTESNILKDDIGYWMNYSIEVMYHEQVNFDVDDAALIGEIKLMTEVIIDGVKIERKV
ncbi:phage tail terminator family protein [Peptostreptococcus sp.]|uniref:phage tail terminator family protein n=1 Tax=Peptostreptococcus sp. TaxID=1262 RepID=UPI001E0FBAC7|nr:hypothetical protein [Peptostreptococcus sp.]MBS5595668.1 hypothetical protein [Peptostreptococcus sp.]